MCDIFYDCAYYFGVKIACESGIRLIFSSSFEGIVIKFKPVFKYDPLHRRLRLIRIIYDNGKKCLSFGLEPYWYRDDINWPNNAITILGVRVNLKDSGGGRYV